RRWRSARYSVLAHCTVLVQTSLALESQTSSEAETRIIHPNCIIRSSRTERLGGLSRSRMISNAPVVLGQNRKARPCGGMSASAPKDGVIGRPSLWIAEDFGC